MILALGQESDTGFLRDGPRASSSSATPLLVDKGTLMTGAPGVFAGGDAVPSQRTVTVGVGHGKRAARSHRRLAARGVAHERPPKHPHATFDKLNLWYFGAHGRREQVELDPAGPGRRPSTRWSAGCHRRRPPSRRGGACRAATASSATAASAACPEDAVIKLGEGLRYEFDLGGAPGAAPATASARSTPSRWSRRADPCA